MSNHYDDRRHRPPSRSPDDKQSTRQRPTDQEIQKWISRQHGFVPESAWIAHCKELFGLAAPGTSHNENPCPPQRSQRLSKRSDLCGGHGVSDRKSTRLNSSHRWISYAVFCLKKKKN